MHSERYAIRNPFREKHVNDRIFIEDLFKMSLLSISRHIITHRNKW